MGRLVVVSNRIAVPKGGKAAAGGLAVAMQAALRASGGVWFGWSGEVLDRANDQVKVTKAGPITYVTVDLCRQDHEDYYNGFANSVLWPLFHYRLDLTNYNHQSLEGYQRVNALFARMLAPHLRPDDTIWIHDYHLIFMAHELRQAGFANRIGFFLHTPFPAYEILTALPHHDLFMKALCACDLVGFQTEHDLRAFRTYVQLESKGELLGDGIVRAYGRTLRAAVFPIGLDTAEVEQQAAEAAKSRHAERLRRSMTGRGLVIGVDRLDYSKGIPQRLQAFEQLLTRHPGNCGRVTLMQIAPPSRTDVQEYVDLRHMLETMAGRINGKFAEFDWTPVRYLNKGFNRRTLTGFFRFAKVGLVTPLRDGMNLVAKEYLASQDEADPGVLVLSRFAGAACELDAALIVNPYDIEGTSDTIQQALSMPLEERQERWRSMIDLLRRNDITAWSQRYIAALDDAPFRAAA
jgi:trehalose 6-phosphate synthase